MTTARPIRSSTPLLALLGILLVLTGCASVTPIGQLLNDPARYNGKTVKVEGQVKGALGGLGVGAFEIKDDTGTIPVVSQRGDPPPTGSKIGVKGKFQALVTLGIKSLAVIREESRFFNR
jgi:hypothetical protein